MRATWHLAALAMATACGGSPHDPKAPAAQVACADRLASFHACSSDPGGTWKLTDTCNDVAPFTGITGCEKATWVASAGTLHIDGSMTFSGSGTCTSESRISVDSTMVLTQDCLYGLGGGGMPPIVCHEVESWWGEGTSASCTWDAKVCTCLVSQVLTESKAWSLTDRYLTSQSQPMTTRGLCMQGNVLAVEETTTQKQGPDVHTLWVYQR